MELDTYVMLSVAIKPFMLSVVMMNVFVLRVVMANVVILIAVAPNKEWAKECYVTQGWNG
jgi:hypothetical protein